MYLGRKIVSEQEARRCLAAAAASRDGLGPWARARGIDGRSLNAWRVNLARRGSVRPRPRPAKLVELVPARPVSPTARYLLRVGELSLEFSDDANELTLKRVVTLLRSC